MRPSAPSMPSGPFAIPLTRSGPMKLHDDARKAFVIVEFEPQDVEEFAET